MEHAENGERIMMKLVIFASTLSLIACGEEKESNTTENNNVFDNNDTDNVDGSGCPADVPEEYRFLWDCENAEGCSAKLYRYGVGESMDDGSFQVTEQWFSFSAPGEYCIDTFEVTGIWDSREPSTFGGGTSEELFQIQWQMVDSQCEVIWSPLFADQEASDPATQTYQGFIMFDTHNSWDYRNEDYEALVVAAPVNGNQYAPNSNYARGTVIPKDPDHEPPGGEQENGEWCCADSLIDQIQPSNYVWANSGDCLQ
jgi:hypothetical protein